MIKTMIIDDEPFLRQYIKNSILSQHPSFSIIGEAGNGEEAWSKIQALAPDVIFIDIKMPLVSGLEVLERCSSLKNPPLSIVLTGYSEFSYAQKALKNHAYDYVLKPVEQDALKDLLNRIKAELSSLHKKIQNQYFFHLLHNQKFVYSVDELKSAFSDIEYFYTYYICVSSYSTCRYNQFSTIGNYWNIFQFDQQVNKLSSDSEQLWILHGETQNDCFIIYGIAKENTQKQSLLFDKIKSILQDSPYPVTLIDGPGTHRLEKLRSRFIELNNAAMNHVVFSFSTVYHITGTETALENVSFLTFAEQKLLSDMTSKRKFGAFKNQLNQYLLTSEEQHCRQCVLTQLLKRICEIANGSHISVSISERIDELITNSSNYIDIREGMSDLLNDIFQTVPDMTSSTVASQIKSYIDQHYTEQISLTSLARNFNFSISYLSSLFKKAYHVSPNEYMISLRIDKAKLLLTENPETSIREAADFVGYTDPYYFSRLFKMMTGTTPSLFRNEILPTK